MGEHGLRKELAAFDMSYFGRAYLSPLLHPEVTALP